MCLYKDGFLSYEGLGFVLYIYIYMCIYIYIYEGLILSYEGFQWWRRRSWTYRWAEGDLGPEGRQEGYLGPTGGPKEILALQVDRRRSRV